MKGEEEKTKISEAILDILKRMRGFENLASCQVDLLSMRQSMVEYQLKLAGEKSRMQKAFNESKKKVYEEMKHSVQTKLSNREENELWASVKLGEAMILMDEINRKIEMVMSSIRTIDQALYQIKERILIEKFTRGE